MLRCRSLLRVARSEPSLWTRGRKVHTDPRPVHTKIQVLNNRPNLGLKSVLCPGTDLPVGRLQNAAFPRAPCVTEGCFRTTRAPFTRSCHRSCSTPWSRLRGFENDPFGASHPRPCGVSCGEGWERAVSRGVAQSFGRQTHRSAWPGRKHEIRLHKPSTKSHLTICALKTSL